jgi:hypothetical protein
MLKHCKRKQGPIGRSLRRSFRRCREGNTAEIKTKSAVMLFVSDDNAISTHLLWLGKSTHSVTIPTYSFPLD